jgi:hypothetical protein
MDSVYNTIGEIEDFPQILVSAPERKRPLRRPRHRWKNNIKI